MNTLGKIVLAIVVLGLLYLAYRFIFKKPEDGTACDSDNDGVSDGIYLNGECVKPDVIDPGIGTGPGGVGGGTGGFAPQFNSVKVSKASTSPAQDPNSFFNGLLESNIDSFNVQKSAGSNPQYIHFDTEFDSQCYQYVWHKKWLYTFVGQQAVAGGSATGEGQNLKTCKYGISKASLPSQLRVRIASPANPCANFRLFISGLEYKYSQTITEAGAMSSAPVTYCIYNKQ